MRSCIHVCCSVINGPLSRLYGTILIITICQLQQRIVGAQEEMWDDTHTQTQITIDRRCLWLAEATAASSSLYLAKKLLTSPSHLWWQKPAALWSEHSWPIVVSAAYSQTVVLQNAASLFKLISFTVFDSIKERRQTPSYKPAGRGKGTGTGQKSDTSTSTGTGSGTGRGTATGMDTGTRCTIWFVNRTQVCQQVEVWIRWPGLVGKYGTSSGRVKNDKTVWSWSNILLICFFKENTTEEPERPVSLKRSTEKTTRDL